MSVASAHPPATAWEQAAKASASPPPHPRDGCPLCGASLHPEQEWCLRCGAAARTRLAAAPNWRAPVAVLAVVIVLSLGVLAAAFVKLAGSGSVATTTTTVTTPAAAAAPAPTAPTPGTPLPGSSSPGATTPGAALPGGASPGTGAQSK
jgi:uncharacterized paraquat-inducible protein A